MRVHYIPDRETWEFNGKELEEAPDPNLFMSIFDTETMSEVRIMFRRRVQPSNILRLNYDYSTLLSETDFQMPWGEVIAFAVARNALVTYVVLKAIDFLSQFPRRMPW